MDLQSLILPPYAVAMSLLGLYGIHRLLMLRRFDSGALERRPDPGTIPPAQELPFVTIQLPIFNEATVAARLLRAAGAMRYPPQRFEIQVLDDSTDRTREIVDSEAQALRERGIEVVVVRREERGGFKAGALNAGMESAKGDLLAIFDADFIPDAGFLEELTPTFADPAVGMVQARWGHENRDDSWLTRAQATLLDGHFVIEHQARHGRGLFFNFNGTAGIWRRAAIDDAGGWQHDTLTEDLDLSYRAQLDGWKFVYVPRVVAPAEVPPEISAFKSQQHRWAKGSVQVFRKLGWRILRSEVPWRVKVEALFHLTGNIGYPCVLILALLLPLSLKINERVAPWIHAAMFILCTISVVMFYERSQRAIARPLRNRLRDCVAAVSLGIGMCVSQTRAVLEGFRRDPGKFVRTPKRGDVVSGALYRVGLKGLPGVELLLALWLGWGVVQAVRLGSWGSMPFLLLFGMSFLWVGTLSLRSWLRRAS